MSKTDIEKIKDFGKKLESSGADYSEATLRDVFTQAGLNSDLTERAIKDYQKYRESEISSLSILTGNDIRQIGAEALAEKVSNLRRGGEIVEEILRGYLRYLNYKKEIVEAYLQSKDWVEVFSKAVYLDIKESQEAFIDYLEEFYQTKVKDAKHLQELTQITHINSYYNKGKMIPITSESDQEERALKELEETLISARYSKYFRALEVALQGGAKYKDLLQIKPEDYQLPETWSGCLASDQYSSILWAISFEFLIDEPASLMMLPDLRSIAEEVEAPYSVLMECYKLFNWQAKTIKKEDDIIYRLKKAVRQFIKNQPKEWRDNHLFNPLDKVWTTDQAKETEESYIDFFPVYFKTVLYHELIPETPLTDFEQRTINSSKEFIYTHFKEYLDEAIEMYEKEKDKAKIFALKRALNNYYLF